MEWGDVGMWEGGDGGGFCALLLDPLPLFPVPFLHMCSATQQIRNTEREEANGTTKQQPTSKPARSLCRRKAKELPLFLPFVLRSFYAHILTHTAARRRCYYHTNWACVTRSLLLALLDVGQIIEKYLFQGAQILHVCFCGCC